MSWSSSRYILKVGSAGLGVGCEQKESRMSIVFLAGQMMLVFTEMRNREGMCGGGP